MSPTSSSWSADELLAHAEFVRALARSLLDEHAADDVAQDTWLAALARPPHDRANVRGWLSAVVSNLAHRVRRTTVRREQRERAVASREPLPSSADLVERLEIAERLVQAVRRLDEPSRRTILLRFFEGVTCDEMARREGVSAAALRARLSRGLARLRVPGERAPSRGQPVGIESPEDRARRRACHAQLAPLRAARRRRARPG
jgi:RNA polymerase sigma-70 factor (ECF subfamily)